MASVGYRKVYLTPHFQARYPNDEADIARRVSDLKKHLKSLNDPTLPEVVAISGEYRFDPLFVRRPGIDRVVPLPNKTLLCEFALHDNRFMPLDIFAEYIKLGYNLILAHPERYPYLNIHSESILRMREMGIRFQINLLSLNGFYGESPLVKGFKYIENGMAEYLGTDLHNTRYANELLDSARNKDIIRLMIEHTFLNDKF